MTKQEANKISILLCFSKVCWLSGVAKVESFQTVRPPKKLLKRKF